MSDCQDNNTGCKLHQFQRNNYFYGKLMTVRDFEDEQSYMNEKRHLLNRTVHGFGIVCGLEKAAVASKDGGGIEITFQTGGFVLDCCGREIIVPDGVIKKVINEKTGSNLTKTEVTTPLFLYLKYKPCYGEMVHAASNPSSCDETCCPNRIIEDFEVIASTSTPSAISLQCPDLSGAATGEEARREIKKWLETANKSCPECDDAKVFFKAVKSDLSNDPDETGKYISLVFDNKNLSDLLLCHVSDYSNPHKTTALQVGAIVSVDGVGNPGGNVDLAGANAVTITPDIAAKKITIGETHSGATGNPHNTKHSELGDVLPVNPANTDAVRNKHVSNADANRWNSSVLSINKLKPDAGGDFTISAGANISISTGTNKITVASTGGGAECLTGLIVFKNVEPKKMYTSGPIALSKERFGIILGVEYSAGLGGKMVQIITGDELRMNGILLTSNLNPSSGELTVSLQSERTNFESLQVRWWAVVPTKAIKTIEVAESPKIIKEDIIKEAALNPGITMKNIMTKYNIEENEIKVLINALEEDGMIKTTGTGVNRKLKIRD